jgi:hypothetical protein
MPVIRNDHQTQFAATPPSRTRFATRFGVSVLNVVATIETPISHHGAACPDVKNSALSRPARRASHNAGRNEIAIDATTMIQSNDVSAMRYMPTIGSGGKLFHRPRVKSGMSTAAAFRPTDFAVSGTSTLSAAAS